MYLLLNAEECDQLHNHESRRQRVGDTVVGDVLKVVVVVVVM